VPQGPAGADARGAAVLARGETEEPEPDVDDDDVPDRRWVAGQ